MPVLYEERASALSERERNVLADLKKLAYPDPHNPGGTFGPTMFIRDEQRKLFVSGEHGDGLVDYYGEGFRHGPCFIHPDIQNIAAKHGGYWEWENPACIYFCER